LGFIYQWRKQHEQAIAEGERAIALDPNYAGGYAILGAILSMAGRPEEAIGLIEKALRLSPRYPVTYLFFLGYAYRLTERYEETITVQKSVLTRNPDYLDAHLELAIMYSELGRGEEARAEAAEVLRISPQFSLEVWRQRIPFEDQAEVERWLAALRKAGLK
jgi:adenylate cyclase